MPAPQQQTPPPSRERYERPHPSSNGDVSTSSPLPSTSSPAPHQATPHASTYSPVLPKTRRQVGGALPSAEVPPRPLVMTDGGSAGSASSQQRQQRNISTNAENNRYSHVAEPHPATPLFLHQQQNTHSPGRDDIGGPSFASSGGPSIATPQRDAHHPRYRDAVSPHHGGGGGGVATLRQSFCAALAGIHAGRLSGFLPPTATGGSHGYASYQERSLSPPHHEASAFVPPPQCPPITTTPQQQYALDMSSVRSPLLLPEDAVSNAGGRRSASPVAVEPFLASVMPRGRHVLLNLLSTWGDANEVGMEKLMLFDGRGQRIVPTSSTSVGARRSVPFTIAADAVEHLASASRGTSPALSPQQRSQYGNDSSYGGAIIDGVPSTDAQQDDDAVSTVLQRRHNVANLVNHAYATTDEQSMYATPFVDGRHHLICITFEASVELSAIRVFNYCGSGRSRTNKGVRLMEVTVDDALAFRGEVAESTASGRDDDCETILFSEDPEVLKRILASAVRGERGTDQGAEVAQDAAQRDGAVVALERRFEDDNQMPSASAQQPNRRKPTSATSAMRTSIAFAPMQAVRETSDVFSPMAVPPPPHGGPSEAQRPNQASLGTIAGAGAPCIFAAEAPKGVTSLCLQVVSTWGDPNYVGLSGLRLRDPQGRLLYNVAHVAINRPSGRRDETFDGDTAALFDGDANTACVWAYEPGLQIIFMFQHPCDVGFIEVSNYSFGRRTHCGIKCARLFISSMPIVSSVSYASSSAGKATASNNVVVASSAPHAARHLSLVYAVLWDDATQAQPGQRRPSGGGAAGGSTAGGGGAVTELTPTEGILLRKAPSQLSALRFQSFDLSLASYGGASSSTGGGSQSLKLSMNARAAVAIRRARQSLLEPPPWLLEHQTYVPCILPVAYVFKVTVVLDATETKPLKQLLCAWATRPQEAVALLNDDGAMVDMNALWCEGVVTYDSNHTAAGGEGDDDDSEAEEDCGSSRVTVTLALVADAPFALAALFLRAPLHLPGDTAGTMSWVHSVMVSADDALVYESAEVTPRCNDDDDDADTPSNGVGGGADRRRIPTVVFFTLDDRALSAYKPR